MAIKCEATLITYFLLFLASTVTLILGALAWSRSSSLFLPLPVWLPATATLLGPITVLVLATTNVFIVKAPRRDTAAVRQQRVQRVLSVLDQLHSVLSTIIATVALAYLFPDSILSCRLEQQWQSYFQSRNAHVIRRIQDTFQCCGFRSIHDRAWPFNDRDHGDNACELQLGYPRSCLVPWREQQQGASWMVFTAAVLIWAVKIAFIQLGRQRQSWMASNFSTGAVDYQRIEQRNLTDGENNNGGEGQGDDEADAGRLLPHATRTPYPNEWEDH